MPASRPSIRTLSPGIFLAIDDIPGVRLFGLGERSAIQQGLAKLPIINFGTHTLTQAAANIVALDLVVTVDTMVAHLAGALNKKGGDTPTPCALLALGN